MVDLSVRARLQRSLGRHSTAAIAAFIITCVATLLPIVTGSAGVTMAIVGFIGALAVAVGLPYLLDLSNPHFRTRSDVERALQLPVLATRASLRETSAIRRIFMAPASGVRSVLFCTTPGDRVSGVASDAADLLAAQSGQRVALVEYPASAHARYDRAHPLITYIDWRPDDRVHDLYTSFSFIVVNAIAPEAEALVSLAREVDGVIVIIVKDETPLDAADALVTTLRRSRANLLGAVFTTIAPDSDETPHSV